jgi:hypothetical protein
MYGRRNILPPICSASVYVDIFTRLPILHTTIPTTPKMQELPTLPEHLSSPPVFSGVRVTRSLFLFLYKKNREHNGQKKKDKRINNHLQNIKQKS